MFDLIDRPLVWISVKWPVLRPGEGEAALAVEVEAEIEVEVEILDRDQLVELFSDIPEIAALAEPAPKPETDEPVAHPTRRDAEVARFLKVVSAWRKIKEGGKAVELNEVNARRMLALPSFASAFEAAYLSACAGRKDIRRGN